MVSINAVAVGAIPANRVCRLNQADGNPEQIGVSLMGGEGSTQPKGEYGIPEFNTTGSFQDGDTFTINVDSMASLWEVQAAEDLRAGVSVGVADGGKATESTGSSSIASFGYTIQSYTAGDIAKIVPYQKVRAGFLRNVGGGASYSNEKAQDAIGNAMTGTGATSVSYDDQAGTITVNSTDTDTTLSNQEVQTAINNDGDHGSTASHNYFSGNYADLSGVSVTSGDIADGTIAEADLGFDTATQGELDTHAGKAGVHHAKYTDGNAVSAVNNASSINPSSVSLSGVLNMPAKSSAPGSPSQGDIYVDDGTNTSSGSVGLRYYDGSAWVGL